jgi:SpoVK/Ycf46/Vps4 family AAA+-type ATPase
MSNTSNNKKRPRRTHINNEIELEYVHINKEINTIDDLIELGNLYYKEKRKKWNIDLRILANLIKPLKKLRNLIGMESVKKNIVRQIVFNIQNLDYRNEDMLHTVIEGPPGVGKTKLASILSEIYVNMGILSSSKIIYLKRDDLVGRYLGETSIKTRKALNECIGGIAFIDEVYSLGNNEGRDSFSKECIDTLTAFLSENKRDFICIIAGYKEDIKTCFFNYNKGLERRFTFRYTIEKYSEEDLKNIFINIAYENNWSIDKKEFKETKFFKENMNYFIFNGGDMENLFAKCKLAHSYRLMIDESAERKVISIKDLEKGMEYYLENEVVANRKETSANNISTNMMYM